MTTPRRRLPYMLAVLLVVGPPLVSSAHLLLDRECDHSVSVGDLDPDPCPFLSILLHAAPGIGAPPVAPPVPDRTAGPSAAARPRPTESTTAATCPSRAPPHVDSV